MSIETREKLIFLISWDENSQSMFRTDFNHWLQNFESDFLTIFLKIVSFFGNTYPLIIICILLISAINFRKGFIILNILTWTAIITVSLKMIIDYPRPIAVDPSLSSYGGKKVVEDLRRLQPEGNFEVFSSEVLQEIRKSEIGRYGLPSGHTSIQIALWIGMAVFFRKKWLWILSISFVILTAWSRMYLGLHYVGDILGGVITGSVVLALISYAAKIYDLEGNNVQITIKHLPFFLLPLVYLPFFYLGGGWQAAILLGANISVWWSSRGANLPNLSNIMQHRILSGITLIVLFFLFFYLARKLGSRFSDYSEGVFLFVAGIIVFSLYLFIAKKFRWITYGLN